MKRYTKKNSLEIDNYTASMRIISRVSIAYSVLVGVIAALIYLDAVALMGILESTKSIIILGLVPILLFTALCYYLLTELLDPFKLIFRNKTTEMPEIILLGKSAIMDWYCQDVIELLGNRKIVEFCKSYTNAQFMINKLDLMLEMGVNESKIVKVLRYERSLLREQIVQV